MAMLLDPLNIRQSQARPFWEFAVAGLALEDAIGARHPQLAEALPSTDAGTWRLYPDGRMETTWRLREGVRWHDGRPITSDDLIFTALVAQDRDLTFVRETVYDLTEGVDALDARTVVVRWKRPYIDADLLFTNPMPRHLLERSYLENPSLFETHGHWKAEYIGAGPFRLRAWVPANYARFEAFPDYVLGRPKIDYVEVRFLADANTLVANILAGSVDITAPAALSIEQALSVRELWNGGTMVPRVQGWTMMYPQLHRPNPPAIGDPQFRKALVHSIDRQQMSDTLTAGYGPVAHSIIPQDHPEYGFVESSIVRYDYDPRRAGQLMAGMGFARGTDGVFRDAAGEPLLLKLQTTTNDTNQKATLATADAFQRLGLLAEVRVIAPSMVGVWRDRYNYPGLDLTGQGDGVRGIKNLLHSSGAPLPERNYTAPLAPSNRGAYVNPEYDALMDRYLTTISIPERMRLLAQLIHWQSDLQLVIGLFYTARGIMIANRLQNTTPGTGWNAHEWEVTR